MWVLPEPPAYKAYKVQLAIREPPVMLVQQVLPVLQARKVYRESRVR